MWDKIKKIDRKYVWAVFAVLFSAMVMLYFKGVFIGASQTDFNEMDANTENVPLSAGTVRQSFNILNDMKYIDMLLANTGEKTENVQIVLGNAQTGEVLGEQTVEVAPSNGMEQQIHLDMQTNGIDAGTELYVEIQSDAENQDVYVCVDSGEYEEQFTQNGTALWYRIRMSITYGLVSLKLFFVITGFFVLVSALIFFVPIKGTKHYNVQMMFLVLGIIGGIAMAVMNPPGQECDGWDHFLRATDVSYGNVLRPFADVAHKDGVIRVPENINDFDFGLVQPNSSYGTVYVKNLQEQSFAKDTILMKYDGGVTSISYYPQAVGIFLGRLFGLSMYGVFLMARLFNLAVYMVIVYFAIKIIPIYKQLMAVVAIMPMMMYQAASCSPDALLNALCFLFSALCIRYALEEEKKLNWKNAIALSAILLVIFVMKYVYICIGLLVFLIPMKRFGEKKDYWKAFGIAMIPLVLIGGYLLLHMFGSVSTLQATTDGISQTQYLKQHPLMLPKVIVATIVQQFDYFMGNVNTLGWLKYPLGALLYIVPCFVVGVACVNTNEMSKKLTRVQKIICVCAGGLCILAVFVGLYIGDGVNNAVGTPVVHGFQGRYILPVLPLLFIGTGSKKIENKIERFSEKAVGGMGLMTAYAVIQLVSYCY